MGNITYNIEKLRELSKSLDSLRDKVFNYYLDARHNLRKNNEKNLKTLRHYLDIAYYSINDIAYHDTIGHAKSEYDDRAEKLKITYATILASKRNIQSYLRKGSEYKKGLKEVDLQLSKIQRALEEMFGDEIMV